jgi:Tfp pilus assembly protein PilN
MIRINLLPSEIYVTEVKVHLRKASFIFVGMIVLILLAFWALRLQKADKLESDLADANSDLRKYQAIVDKVNELEVTRNQLRARRDVIKPLLVGRLLYPKFFEDFMAVLPSEIWVTTVGTTLDAQGVVSVNVNAQALSCFAIADWLTNLQSSPYCSDVRLGAISAQEETEGRSAVYSFTMTFRYLRRDV